MKIIAASLTAALVVAGAPALGARSAVLQDPATTASTAQAPADSTIIQRVIVKVNGEIFTQTELEQRQIQALRDQNKQVQSLKDLQNDATLRAALAQVTPDLLVNAVDELLLVQHGRELGYRMSEEQFQQSINRVKQDNKLDDKGLDEALKSEGMTRADYRQMIERQWTIMAVQQQEIMTRTNLTEEEERQYYAAHKNDFMKPATVMLREIFVPVQTTTQGTQQVFNAADDEAAKAKVTAARARVVAGEDFAKVAAEVSESGSKTSGGLIGPVAVADMTDELRAVLDKLAPGGMTEPLRTPRGYQLFQLESRTAAEAQPFDAVRDQISQRIYNDRLEGETNKFLTKLRSQALIEWKDDNYKQIYEKRLAERTAETKKGQ